MSLKWNDLSFNIKKRGLVYEIKLGTQVGLKYFIYVDLLRDIL